MVGGRGSDFTATGTEGSNSRVSLSKENFEKRIRSIMDEDRAIIQEVKLGDRLPSSVAGAAATLLGPRRTAKIRHGACRIAAVSIISSIVTARAHRGAWSVVGRRGC
jgi:hypothetical protein